VGSSSQLLRGFPVLPRRVPGEKAIRARPVAAAAENGLIRLVRARHSSDFLDELSSFPHGRHDDCVDALAGAHAEVSRGGGRATTHSAAGHRIQPPRRIPLSGYANRFPRDRDERALEELAGLIGATIHPSPPPGIVTRHSRRGER
jgi:hypothetical protein